MLISSASRILHAPLLSIFSPGDVCVLVGIELRPFRGLGAFVGKVWFADANLDLCTDCERASSNSRFLSVVCIQRLREELAGGGTLPLLRNESVCWRLSSGNSWSDLSCPGIAHLINRCPCRASGQQERCEMQGITLGNFPNRSAIRRNGDWLFRC
jgi:hypothetical protein